jgi:hypothetical protein
MEDKKSSYNINIVKSNYTNVSTPERIVQEKISRYRKWSVFHHIFNTNKYFTDIDAENFKELEEKLVLAFN